MCSRARCIVNTTFCRHRSLMLKVFLDLLSNFDDLIPSAAIRSAFCSRIILFFHSHRTDKFGKFIYCLLGEMLFQCASEYFKSLIYLSVFKYCGCLQYHYPTFVTFPVLFCLFIYIVD